MTSPHLTYLLEDKSYEAGDLVTAEFTTKDFNAITGYQFAMKFDSTNLSFVGVEFPASNPLGLTSGYFSWPNKPGYRVDPGTIRHLFSIPKGKTLADNTKIFSYVFKALKSGTLSDNLSLATCCLKLPLKPSAYYYKNNYQTFSVEYSNPLEESFNLEDSAKITA